MQRAKRLVVMLMACLMLFGTVSVNAATLSKSGADTPALHAMYIRCSTCGTTTPFDECGVCRTYDPNNPYHCRVCGMQRGHSDWGSCPAW